MQLGISNLLPGHLPAFLAGYLGSGALLIGDPGVAGAYVAGITDNLLINGATVGFAVTTPGAIVTLAVAGDADITAGGVTVPSVDALNVAGQVNQSGGTVDANGGAVTVAGPTTRPAAPSPSKAGS